MGIIRYESLFIVIDGKCVYVLQNSHTYGGVGNSVEWQEPIVWLKVEGAKPQSMNVGSTKLLVLGRGPGRPLPREMLKIKTWNSAI